MYEETLNCIRRRYNTYTKIVFLDQSVVHFPSVFIIVPLNITRVSYLLNTRKTEAYLESCKISMA